MLLHQHYIQKSKVILYPLLGILKDLKSMQHETYLGYKDIVSIDEPSIVMILDKTATSFEDDLAIAESNSVYVGTIDEDDTIKVLKFSLEEYANLYALFCKGQYSHFYSRHKEVIVDYYSKRKIEGFALMLIKSHLYPQDYYELYAEWYKTTIDVLEQAVETLSKPDLEKEHYQ